MPITKADKAWRVKWWIIVMYSEVSLSQFERYVLQNPPRFIASTVTQHNKRDSRVNRENMKTDSQTKELQIAHTSPDAEFATHLFFPSHILNEIHFQNFKNK